MQKYIKTKMTAAVMAAMIGLSPMVCAPTVFADDTATETATTEAAAADTTAEATATEATVTDTAATDATVTDTSAESADIFQNIDPIMERAGDALPVATAYAMNSVKVYSDTSFTEAFATILYKQPVQVLVKETDYAEIKVGPYAGYVKESDLTYDKAALDAAAETSADTSTETANGGSTETASDAASTDSTEDDLVAMTLGDGTTVYVSPDDVDKVTQLALGNTSAASEDTSADSSAEASTDASSEASTTEASDTADTEDLQTQLDDALAEVDAANTKITQLKELITEIQQATADLEEAHNNYTLALVNGDADAQTKWAQALEEATNAYYAAASEASTIQ